MFIYFSCYFDIDQGHPSSKQIEKENKPRRVIGLDNAIKGRFKWYEKGSGKSYIMASNRVSVLRTVRHPPPPPPKLWGEIPAPLPPRVRDERRRDSRLAT